MSFLWFLKEICFFPVNCSKIKIFGKKESLFIELLGMSSDVNFMCLIGHCKKTSYTKVF